jgi:hypothetical protein
MSKHEGGEARVEGGTRVDDGGTPHTRTALNGLGPEAIAELPFSEMISRWLDAGDRMHESVPAAGEPGADVAAHPGRLSAFIDEARARAHRHRRMVAGAGLLAVVLLVVAFRHSARVVSAGDARGAASAVIARRPTTAPGAQAPAVAGPAAVEAPVIAAPVAAQVRAAEAAEASVVSAPPAAEATETSLPAATRQAHAATQGEATPPGEVAAPVAEAQSARGAAGAPAEAGGAADTERTEPRALPAGRAAEPPRPMVAPLEGCKTALVRQRARDALANCRQLFAGEPHSADAMVLLARADLLAGRPGETLQLAQRAVGTNPRYADAYLLIGTVEQTEGHRQEARTAYETYLALAPFGAHASDVKAILRTL